MVILWGSFPALKLSPPSHFLVQKRGTRLERSGEWGYGKKVGKEFPSLAFSCYNAVLLPLLKRTQLNMSRVRGAVIGAQFNHLSIRLTPRGVPPTLKGIQDPFYIKARKRPLQSVAPRAKLPTLFQERFPSTRVPALRRGKGPLPDNFLHLRRDRERGGG